MSGRSFPVVYSTNVEVSARFYEGLGWEERLRSCTDDVPTFIRLSRAEVDIAIASVRGGDSRGPYGTTPGIELFVVVDELDRTVDSMREAGVPIVSEPTLMPWGERVARVLDPDKNRVSLICEV